MGISRRALLAILLGACALRPAQSEDVPPILQRVADKYYNAGTAGLRDVEVVVRNPRFAKILADAVVRVYWKGGRTAARIENYKPELASRVPALQRQLREIARNIVPETIVELARRSTVTVKEEGSLTHVLLATRGDGDDGLNHYWFDPDLRIVRSVSEVSAGGKPQRTDFDQLQIEERDGRFVVVQMKGVAPAGPAEVRWEYERVGEFWLPSKMTHVTGRETETTMFVDYKVNQGLGDELFQE